MERAGEDDEDGRMYFAVPLLFGWVEAEAWFGCILSNWSGLMVGFSRSFWSWDLGKMPFRGDGVSVEDKGAGGWMLNKLSWTMGRLDVDDSRRCLGGETNSGVVLAVVFGCGNDDEDDDISALMWEYSSAGGPKNTSLCNSSWELRSGTSIEGNSGNSWSRSKP